MAWFARFEELVPHKTLDTARKKDRTIIRTEILNKRSEHFYFLVMPKLF